MKSKWIIVCLLLTSSVIRAQMNNPYVDDKLVHFGFSLSMNFMGFGVQDSHDTIGGEIYHARVSSLMPGFSVGFITDLRLCRHLNLRFTPTLHFGQKSLTYKTESGNPVQGSPGNGNHTDLLSLPISIPLYLKWSAEREKNYRPYIIAGGGAQYDFGGQKDRPIYVQKWDYFISFGFGCDVYLKWFKLCPEIKYQIGFKNALTPVEQRMQLSTEDYLYTNALKKLTNQMLTVSFNFE